MVDQRVPISIITLTWDHLAYTRLAVNSIKPLLQEDDEIIFVDNNSNNDTKNFIRDLKLPCKKKYYLSSENISISQGYNIGLRKSVHPYIFIYDNDLEIVMPNTFDHMLGVFKKENGVGIVCPKINNVVGRARACEGVDELPNKIIEVREKKYRGYPSCASAAWLMTRECMKIVGEFDERFDKYGMLDFDYAKRVLLAKFRIVVDGFIFVQHYGSITAKEYMNGPMLQEMGLKYRKKWGLPCPGDPGIPRGGWHR